MREQNNTFNEYDVFALVNLVPKRWYHSESSLGDFLADTIETAENLKEVLNLYPTVLCEPLDNHYILLRALGSTNEELIFDLCTFNPYKCSTFAAFLACLKPEESYKKYLITAKENLIHIKDLWIIDLAIDEINGTSWKSFPTISSQLHNLRKLFKDLKVPKIEMRKMWNSQEIEEFAAKQAMVKKVYKEKGADAALAMIKDLNLLK